MIANAPPIQAVVEVPPPDAIPNAKEDPVKGGTEPDKFPEGGMMAWCTILGGTLLQFCSVGYTTSFGVYQAFYTLSYLNNESASAIAWIGGINAFLLPVVSLVSGMLFDRGYCYHLVICGSLMQSFFLFALSLAQPGQYYQIFLTQGIGLGLAQGLVYIPSLALASHYFRERRTLAMSLVTAGSSLGSVVHPIMLNYVFNQNIGFANGVRMSAALNSILLFTACFLIRTRLEPPNRPANYLLVGRGIMSDLPFCLMSIGFIIFQIAFYFPLFYLQLDSTQHGNSATFSFYSLAFLNGGSLIGRLSTGFIARGFGIPRLMIIATAACGVVILGMIGLYNIPSVVILGTLYGYFSGIYVALWSPLTTLLTYDLSELGARLGIVFMLSGIGSLLSGPISGALLTSHYKWWQPSLFNSLAALTASWVFVLMELTWRRRRPTERQASDA